MKKSSLKHIINDSKTLIDKKLYIFLFILLKKIFIKITDDSSDKIESYLDSFINKVNEKIIIKKDKFINKEYSIQNFDNILHLVKSQNRIYAGEIIEGILIYIFSFAFKTDKDNTFGKYIFNILSKFNNINNLDIANWFDKNKFKPKELQDIKQLLKEEYSYEDNFSQVSPFFHLLKEINKIKYTYISKEVKKNKTINYINNGNFVNFKILNKIFNSLKDNCKIIYDKDFVLNSIQSLISNINSNENCEVRSKQLIIKAFLFSVFIYYQNKNSPLMKFIDSDKKGNKNNLVNIPFVYDLKGAVIDGRFSNIIISPCRLEPRINELNFEQNNLRECGLFELSKTLIFNKNIKIINLKMSLIRSFFIDYLNIGLGVNDNYFVEELNLSYNYIKEDSEDYLAKLISHFKGLKTINFSSNELKGGLSSFLVVLKNLYRQKKTKLENLFLNKCSLDNSSFYELGELLKCKYCKLKKLYLNNNIIPKNINFLKKLKKNKSLTEIYLNNNDIGNKDVNNILIIINNTQIKYLYLFKNKIDNLNEGLRIIYRTKIINDDLNNKNIVKKNESSLLNLDLSNNNFMFKNSNHIKILTNIIKKSTLICLDFSHILYGRYPDKRIITSQ